MVYCDFSTYQKIRGPAAGDTADEWAIFATRASRVIDRLTHGRAKLYTAELEDELADACAQIAELLCRRQQIYANGLGLASATSDGYAESYADPLQASQATERACYAALANALGEDRYGMLYAGVI